MLKKRKVKLRKVKLWKVKLWKVKFILILFLLSNLYILYMNLNKKNPKLLLAENKIKILNNSNLTFNHIHVSFSFDNNYYLLSSVAIASILKNSYNNTFIHFHIIQADNFTQETKNNLTSLSYKINNNSEFIFYDGTKIISDLGDDIKKHNYGVGEYCRLITSELVLEDKVLVLDSGDIIAEKDLTELFNIPLNDKLALAVLDPYVKCFHEYPLFKKENYINGGVVLINAKKWREMGIYKYIIKFYKEFNYKGRLPLPFQDILNTFLPYLSIGIIPLKYNYQYDSSIFYSQCIVVNRSEIDEAKNNTVIRHNNKAKPQKGIGDYVDKWNYYKNLTGFQDELCKKYPSGCRYKSFMEYKKYRYSNTNF